MRSVPGFLARAAAWLIEDGLWWLCSCLFHAVLIASLGFIGLMGAKAVLPTVEEAPAFRRSQRRSTRSAPQNIERFEVGETPRAE